MEVNYNTLKLFRQSGRGNALAEIEPDFWGLEGWMRGRMKPDIVTRPVTLKLGFTMVSEVFSGTGAWGG